MNCMEARRMVTPYVQGELSEKELECFLRHIEQCSDCMEELDIYFTMYQAMDRLDTGKHHEYDFKKMLEENLHQSRRRILAVKIFRAVRWLTIGLAELLLILSVAAGVHMKLGKMDKDVFLRTWLNFYRPAEQLSETESDVHQTEDLTETESDVRQTETLTETESDVHQTENLTEAKSDGRQTEKQTEAKSDGRQTENLTEAKSRGRQTENLTEKLSERRTGEKETPRASEQKK